MIPYLMIVPSCSFFLGLGRAAKSCGRHRAVLPLVRSMRDGSKGFADSFRNVDNF